MNYLVKIFILLCMISNPDHTLARVTRVLEKPRIIVTSDGEIDDQCSMIRFLLYTNEWNVEGIVTSSSQYHW
jgi:hypothetical protein